MDLNTIIVDQIKSLSLAEEQRKAEAKKQAEAEAVVRAEEEAKKKAIMLIENKKEFESEKVTFESSFVREIMDIIIIGLNSKDEKYLFLKEKLIKMCRSVNNGIRPKFFLQKPKLFKDISGYWIDFRYGDLGDIMTFYSSKDDQISTYRNIYLYEFHHRDKRELLSSNKEEAAVQIIEFLMTY